MLATEGTDETVFGFTMPLDRYYHRGHAWVKYEGEGMYLVGLDDFGKRMIGTPDAVELPAVGTPLTANGTGAIFKKERASLRLLSPINGVVVESGTADGGWLLKVRGGNPEAQTRHLLRGDEIRPWILRELEQLQIAGLTGRRGVSASLMEANSSPICGGTRLTSIGMAYGERCSSRRRQEENNPALPLQIILFQPVIKCRPVDSQYRRRLLRYSLASAARLNDDMPFRLFQRDIGRDMPRHSSPICPRYQKRNILIRQQACLARDDRPFNGIFQFPYIARPFMIQQNPQGAF